MTFAHGKDTDFRLDDSGGTLRNLSAFTDKVSGLPGAGGLSGVTAFGDAGTKNIRGLFNGTFTASGHYDGTATTGPIAVLNSLSTATVTATAQYGPDSSTTGKIKYTCECWLTDYSIDSSVTEKTSWSATFQIDGTVTTGTY